MGVPPPDVKFLGVEEPDFTEVGESLAESIKARIQAAPGNRWNRSGVLLNSISSVERNGSVAVVASGARLQHDKVAELFAAEILPAELDAKTRDEIARAIFDSFEVDQ